MKGHLREGGREGEREGDNRVSISINKNNPSIRNRCYICRKLNNRMINCANPSCNIHTAICRDCGIDFDGTCSEKCKNAPNKRKYDGTGYYQTKLNGYNPRKGLMNYSH